MKTTTPRSRAATTMDKAREKSELRFKSQALDYISDTIVAAIKADREEMLMICEDVVGAWDPLSERWRDMPMTNEAIKDTILSNIRRRLK
jgi:hypothetical protein